MGGVGRSPPARVGCVCACVWAGGLGTAAIALPIVAFFLGMNGRGAIDWVGGSGGLCI